MISKTFDIDLQQTNECNFSIVRGDTFQLIVNVKNDGVVFDMTGYTPILTAMKSKTATTPDIQLLGADVDTTNAATGKLTFTFAPSDTVNLVAGNYYYDIEITTGAIVRTLIISTIELVQDFTSASLSQIATTNTYASLSLLITNSTLYPGRFYKITDYTDVNTGLEPLIVLAIKTNQLSPIAFSETNPDDIIYYNPTSDQIAEPGCTTGYIYKRITTTDTNQYTTGYIYFAETSSTVTSWRMKGNSNGDLVFEYTINGSVWSEKSRITKA